jgi:hypothetical protein
MSERECKGMSKERLLPGEFQKVTVFLDKIPGSVADPVPLLPRSYPCSAITCPPSQVWGITFPLSYATSFIPQSWMGQVPTKDR